MTKTLTKIVKLNLSEARITLNIKRLNIIKKQTLFRKKMQSITKRGNCILTVKYSQMIKSDGV